MEGKRQLGGRERVCSFDSACTLVKGSGLDPEERKWQVRRYEAVNMVVVLVLLQSSVLNKSRGFTDDSRSAASNAAGEYLPP